MTPLILGLVLFFTPHSVAIVGADWRDRTAARIGEGAWKGGYALVSAVGLILIIWGYAVARQEPVLIYQPPLWLRHISMLLMLFVFPLLFAAYLPGRIKAATKHPMLAAVKIWAFAHLLTNGTLADLLLFGAFLVWAIVDRISLKRRPARAIPGAPPSALNDVIAVVGGLVFYAVFVLWLHRWLIGVPVMI